jgi:hypothetical protein
MIFTSPVVLLLSVSSGGAIDGFVITGRGAAGVLARLVRFFLRVCASPSTRQKLAIRQKATSNLM